MAKYTPPCRDEHDTCPDCCFDGVGNRFPCPGCEAEIEAIKDAVLRILDGDRPSR